MTEGPRGEFGGLIGRRGSAGCLIGRVGRAGWVLVAAAGVAVSGSAISAASADAGARATLLAGAESETATGRPDGSEWERLGLRVLDQSLTSAERLQAAAELWRLGDADDSASRAEIGRLIESDADAAERLVRSAASVPSLRCWAVVLILSAGDRANLPNETVAALSVVRTRTGAKALLEIGRTRAGTEEAVVQALSKLTLHPRPPATVAGWESLLGPLLEDADAWGSALVGWSIAEAERARGEAAQLHGRLATALRRHFAATTGTDERTALLASWLSDPMPMIRGLAMELAQRELVNARPLGAALGHAAVQLLQRPEASARRDGAQLLASVGVEPAPIAELAAAIAQETDAAAASAMMETAARWPSPVYLSALLRWVESGERSVATKGVMPPEFVSALRLVRSMLQSEWKPGEDETVVLLSAVRAAAAAGVMTPSAMQVLATLGNDADRRVIYAVAVSSDSDAARRSAAARALSDWNDWTGALVDAASRDSAVFDAACDSAAKYAATPEVVARLAATPDVPDDRLSAGILRVASGLDIAGVVSAAGMTASPVIRVRLLSPVAGNGLSSVASPALKIRGLTMLAESQLQLGEASQSWATAALIEKALTENELAAEPVGSVERARAVQAVVVSAVAAGRVERFESLSGTLRDWLSALDRAPNAEVSSQTAGFILRRFSNELEDVVAARLRSLANPIIEPDKNAENADNIENAENPDGDDPDTDPDPGVATEPVEPEYEPTIAALMTHHEQLSPKFSIARNADARV